MGKLMSQKDVKRAQLLDMLEEDKDQPARSIQADKRQHPSGAAVVQAILGERFGWIGQQEVR